MEDKIKVRGNLLCIKHQLGDMSNSTVYVENIIDAETGEKIADYLQAIFGKTQEVTKKFAEIRKQFKQRDKEKYNYKWNRKVTEDDIDKKYEHIVEFTISPKFHRDKFWNGHSWVDNVKYGIGEIENSTITIVEQ